MKYEFYCNKCDTGFDVYCEVGQRNKKHKCEHCESDDIKRVYTPVGMSRRFDLCPPCGMDNMIDSKLLNKGTKDAIKDQNEKDRIR